MGLKEMRERMAKARAEKAEEKKEREAYKKIIDKRNLQARRQAYAEESKKVAYEKGKALARKPSIGELLKARVEGGLRAKVSGTRPTVARAAPTRRRRKATVRKAPVRRTAKRKVKRVVKSVKRKRKAVRRTTQVKQAQPQQFNQYRMPSLNEVIGY